MRCRSTGQEYSYPMPMYANSMWGEIVWDDRAAISNNPDVTSSAAMDELLVHDFWGAPMNAPDSHKSYRPLTVLSYRLNHAMHGLSPAGYHAVNVVLHMLVSCLVLRFAGLLFKAEPDSVEIGLTCGLLFAVHPVHTEAVCALVGRADLLCAAFSLAALLHFEQATRYHTVMAPPLFAALLCVTCATLAKETGITLVAVCVAYDALCGVDGIWASLRRGAVRAARTAGLPAALLPRPGMLPSARWPARSTIASAARRGGVLAVFAFAVMRARLALHGDHLLYQWTVLENHFALLPFGFAKVMSYGYAHARYLLLLLWPRPGDLCFDHGFDATPVVAELWDNRHITTVAAYCAFLALLAAVILHGSAQLLFCVVFAAVSFLPASHVLLPVGTIVGERLLLAGWAQAALSARVTASASVRRQLNWPALVARMPLAILLLLWSWHTVARNAEWRSERSLFESAMAVNPRSLKVLNNLGQDLLRDDPARAAAVLERAVAIMPNYIVGTLNLGLAYHAQGTGNASDAAVQTLRRSLLLDPTQNKARAYLGTQLMTRWLAAGGDEGKGDAALLQEAIGELKVAAGAGSTLPILHHSLGSALYYARDHQGALQHYELALRLNERAKVSEPHAVIDGAKTHNMLALTLSEMGREDDAVRQYEIGMLLHPDGYELRSNAAGLLLGQGQVERALELYRQALALAPSSAELANNLGYVYEQHSRLHEAMASYELALARLPNHAQIQTNVNNLRAKITRNNRESAMQ
eukprot:g2379.t1